MDNDTGLPPVGNLYDAEAPGEGGASPESQMGAAARGFVQHVQTEGQLAQQQQPAVQQQQQQPTSSERGFERADLYGQEPAQPQVDEGGIYEQQPAPAAPAQQQPAPAAPAQQQQPESYTLNWKGQDIQLSPEDHQHLLELGAGAFIDRAQGTPTTETPPTPVQPPAAVDEYGRPVYHQPQHPRQYAPQPPAQGQYQPTPQQPYQVGHGAAYPQPQPQQPYGPDERVARIEQEFNAFREQTAREKSLDAMKRSYAEALQGNKEYGELAKLPGVPEMIEKEAMLGVVHHSGIPMPAHVARSVKHVKGLVDAVRQDMMAGRAGPAMEAPAEGGGHMGVTQTPRREYTLQEIRGGRLKEDFTQHLMNIQRSAATE